MFPLEFSLPLLVDTNYLVIVLELGLLIVFVEAVVEFGLSFRLIIALYLFHY